MKHIGKRANVVRALTIFSFIFLLSLTFGFKALAQGADDKPDFETYARAALGSKLSYKSGPLEPYLEVIAEFFWEAKQDETLKDVLRAIDRIETDRTNWPEFHGRDKEVVEVLDTLVRSKHTLPLVVGDTGTGKTSVIVEAIHRMASGQVPDGLHKIELSDPIVFRISSRGFYRLITGTSEIQLAFAFGNLFEALNVFKVYLKKLGIQRKPILVIADTEKLLPRQFEEIVRNQEGQSPIPIILEANIKGKGAIILEDERFYSKAKQILVEEFSVADVIATLKTTVSNVESRYNIQIEDSFLKALVEISRQYRPDMYEPSRSLQLLDDLAVYVNRVSKGKKVTPALRDLYTFVAQRSGIRVVPQDREVFIKDMELLNREIKEEVDFQDALVDGLVEQWKNMLLSTDRPYTSAMIMGPTGVGKSFGSYVLGTKYFKSKRAVLRIDMTQYQTVHDESVLFGASNGLISSDTSRGIINEWLDGAGSNGGVLIMDEIDKAHPKILQRLMELLDNGRIRGGDSRERRLNRHFLLFTSNKKTNRLIPYDVIKNITRSELDRRLKGITEAKLKEEFTSSDSYAQNPETVTPREVAQRIDHWYYASPILLEEAVTVTQKHVKKFIKSYPETGSVGQLEVDPNFANILTHSIYTQEDGLRQIRRAVPKWLNRAVEEFEKKYGYKHGNLIVSAVVSNSNLTAPTIVVQEAGTKKVAKFPGPIIPVQNILLDPEKRARLQSLAERLGSRVFGQDEAINAIVSSVKGKSIRGRSKKPGAIVLMGITGSGKTELGKALGVALTDREDGYKIFKMSEVKTKHDMQKIFSPPPGIEGASTPREFENMLIRFGDVGGVAIFDEMDKVGGADKSLKEEGYTQFYAPIDEGTWTNPNNKTYTLENITLVFTTNDGQDILNQIGDDNLRDEVWEQTTSEPKAAEDIFRKGGAPDAFIGRVDAVIFMKPPKPAVKLQIVDKLITLWKEMVEEDKPYDIVVSSDLKNQIASLMWSPSEGARSYGKFIETTVSSLVADAIFDSNIEELLNSGNRAQIKVSIESQNPVNPFYKDKPVETKAVLVVQISESGKMPKEYRHDFTKQAFFRPQISEEEGRRVGRHEMGHAVLNQPEISGKRVRKITNLPARVNDQLSAAGYTSWQPIKGFSIEGNEEYLISEVATLMAGSLAELRAGSKSNAGRSNDITKAGELVRELMIKHKIYPELDVISIYLDKDGKVQLSGLPNDIRKLIDDKAKFIMNQAAQRANRVLDEQWAVVEAGVEKMMKTGVITGDDLEQIRRDLGFQNQTMPEKQNVVNYCEALF